MKKYILPVILILILLWLAFDKVTNIGLSSEFKAKQDSLVAAVDSLVKDNHQKDLHIGALEHADFDLRNELENAKGKVTIITKWVDSSKGKVDTWSEKELVSSFNQRYPADTVTNPLPVAQPVLASAAKDLIELEGAKQTLEVKDSIISLNEKRIVGKDSVISLYIGKEANYKNIMTNQETQIKDWKDQFKNLQLQNAKLKAKSKFTKIGAGIVAGGLAFLLLAK